MKILFILSILLIFYSYIAYPIYVWFAAKYRHLPVRKGLENQLVSIVISARNEEKQIGRKLNNIFSSHYPSRLIEIIIISDGSTDGTVASVETYKNENPDKRVQLIVIDKSQGKPSALNKGVALATSDIIVFADTRQEFDSDAISCLVSNFSDPSVGCVSGELKFENSPQSHIEVEMGLYWRYEKFIRMCESNSGSVVGATGAIYAIRKCLYQTLPPETLIDDVVTPLNIAMQGYRVILDRSAVAFDVVSKDNYQEWRRKVRTLAGNWQLIEINKNLFNPQNNPLFWRLIGHKFSRLLVPFSLILLFLISAVLNGFVYRFALCAQSIFYFGVLFVYIFPQLKASRFLKFSYFFVLLNSAAVAGFYYWSTRQCGSLWQNKSS